nr:MAG TPA: cysteine-rich protein [Caudoviricetes sp.]
MSIKSAFESEGIDFSNVMNPPEPWNGQALLKNINGQLWICCPFCQKKVLLIKPNTKIQNLSMKCKGSNCKKEFEVNV